MKQGLSVYDKRTKKQYRGWVFNRAKDMLACNPGEATIVYLCGPEDKDRLKATWKGFNPANMLAVDMQKDNVASCRKTKGTAYHGKLNDVIQHFGRKIDFLHADYCCGLTGDALGLIYQLRNQNNTIRQGTIVSVNMQRGRENWNGTLDRIWSEHEEMFYEYDIRQPDDEYPDDDDTLADAWLLDDVFAQIQKSWLPNDEFGEIGIHRGRMWMKLAVMNFATDLLMSLRAHHENPCSLLEGKSVYDLEYAMYKLATPQYYSYRSNKVPMDAVVFQMPTDPFILDTCKQQPKKKVRQKLAAAKAVMTMRQKA